MATGETDSSTSLDYLLLGWDGLTLQWCAGYTDVLVEYGEEPAVEDVELRAACASLRSKGLNPEKVIFTYRHAHFSLAPSALADGVESDLLALHIGASVQADNTRTFHSVAFGEELALMEWTEQRGENVVRESWSHVRVKSSTLGWMEGAVLQERERLQPAIFVDIGAERALMARVEGGALVWGMVTQDMEGEGILYHVVNALYRADQAPGTAGTMVFLSGEVEVNDPRWLSFERFFPRVVMHTGFHPLKGVDADDWKPQRWALLTHFSR